MSTSETLQNIIRQSKMTQDSLRLRSLRVAGHILRQKCTIRRKEIDALPNFFPGAATLIYSGQQDGLITIDHYKTLIQKTYETQLSTGGIRFPDTFDYKDVLSAIILISQDFEKMLIRLDAMDIMVQEFYEMISRWSRDIFVREDSKFFEVFFGVDIFSEENSISAASLMELRSQYVVDWDDLDVYTNTMGTTN